MNNTNEYSEYLIKKNLERSIKNYVGSISVLSKTYSVDIFEINSVKTFAEIKEKIVNDENFISKDTTGNGQYSAALNHYYDFLLNKNKYFITLKNSIEIEKDSYDGSYELVRETVKQYDYIDENKITYVDLDLIYFMTVGTWKCSFERKEKLIEQSNLGETQKKYLKELLNEIKTKASEKYYANMKDGNIGMFGTYFSSFNKGSNIDDLNNSARKFISLCKKVNDSNFVDFEMINMELQFNYINVGIATVSQIFHCLKPEIFPIINQNQGQGYKIYEELGINIDKKISVQNYIQNLKLIEKFRNKYFTWKNYRVFDLIHIEEKNEKEKIMNIKYWWLYVDSNNSNILNMGVGGLGDYKIEENQIIDFGKINKNDVIIIFDKEINDAIVGICKAESTAKNNTILLKKAENFINPIPLSQIVANEVLKESAFINTDNNVLFELSEDEINLLEMIIRQKNFDKTYDKEKFLGEVFINEDKYDEIVNLLKRKKNIILQGAPGVGKTFMAKRLAYSIMQEKDSERIEFIQFHQSYSYEDFIEGYRPAGSNFELQKGIFYEFCKKAEQDDRPYYLIIDEINRGNLSKIFGELLMLIEKDKREEKLKLLYSKEEFAVPSNLYIIGLMNTADRSLAILDYALRRRFSFVSIDPAFDNTKFKEYINKVNNDYLNKIIERIKLLNNDISEDASLGKGFEIGHSYFCELEGVDEKEIKTILKYEIVPLLEEYWIDDEDKLKEWKLKLLED